MKFSTEKKSTLCIYTDTEADFATEKMECEVRSLRRELEGTRTALRLQTVRCRQLVAAFTTKLQEKEREVRQGRDLRDEQLSRVLRALIVLEARLRKEQTAIREQLGEKDSVIRTQQLEIARLNRLVRAGEPATRFKKNNRVLRVASRQEQNYRDLHKLTGSLQQELDDDELRGRDLSRDYQHNPVLECVNQILLQDQEEGDEDKNPPSKGQHLEEKTCLQMAYRGLTVVELPSPPLRSPQPPALPPKPPQLGSMVLQKRLQVAARLPEPGKTSPPNTRAKGVNPPEKPRHTQIISNGSLKVALNLDNTQLRTFDEKLDDFKMSVPRNHHQNFLQKNSAENPETTNHNQNFLQKNSSENTEPRKPHQNFLQKNSAENPETTNHNQNFLQKNSSENTEPRNHHQNFLQKNSAENTEERNHHQNFLQKNSAENTEARKPHQNFLQKNSAENTEARKPHQNFLQMKPATNAETSPSKKANCGAIKVGCSVSSLITGSGGGSIVSELALGESDRQPPVGDLVRRFESVSSCDDTLSRNFEEFKLEDVDMDRDDSRPAGDGEEAGNLGVQPPGASYEHFIEATGLSHKSILTPSRMFSNHKSVLKPKDVKHRSKVLRAQAGISSSPAPSNGPIIKYWIEPGFL